MPPYRRLFKRTYRIERMVCGTIKGGELNTRISEAMGLKSGQVWYADNVIAPDSPLVKYCDFPPGPVNLGTRGMAGIIQLLHSRLFGRMYGTLTQEFKQLAKELEDGFTFVKRYEHLALQIESISAASRSKVKMAISRCIGDITPSAGYPGIGGKRHREAFSDRLMELPRVAARTALREVSFTPSTDERFDPERSIRQQEAREQQQTVLAEYFTRYIHTGKLIQHLGPWLWDVRGLGGFPDVVELAEYHYEMRQRRQRLKESGRTSRLSIS
jgi:hypothetical protein